MRSTPSIILALAFAGVLLAGAAHAQAPNAMWGDLTGQFLCPGDAPAPKPLVPAAGKAAGCAPGKLVDESLLLNPKNHGVANVVVWIFPGAAKLPIHPALQAVPAQPVKMNNVACRFEPHITFARAGQKIVIGNGDATGHNTKIEALNQPGINPVVPAGGTIDAKFDVVESLPVNVSCSMHDWMTAKLVVKDHPYVAVSDVDGKFTIKDLPVGAWDFKVWHESGGYIKDINGNKLKSGVWAVTVKAGANDAGQLTVKLKN